MKMRKRAFHNFVSLFFGTFLLTHHDRHVIGYRKRIIHVHFEIGTRIRCYSNRVSSSSTRVRCCSIRVGCLRARSRRRSADSSFGFGGGIIQGEDVIPLAQFVDGAKRSRPASADVGRRRSRSGSTGSRRSRGRRPRDGGGCERDGGGCERNVGTVGQSHRNVARRFASGRGHRSRIAGKIEFHHRAGKTVLQLLLLFL